MEPPLDADCWVGEPKIFPPSAGFAAVVPPNIEPPVLAVAVEPNGLVADAPPKIDPPLAGATKPVLEAPPKMLPPAAGGLVPAAAAANNPVAGGDAPGAFVELPKTD